MTVTRPALKCAAILGGAILFYLIGTAVLAHAAHADTGPPAPPPEFGWQVYLAIAIAAAGGALKIIDVLLAGLRWLAPRTETTIDDSARDGLQVVHDKLDAVLAAVGKIVPPSPTASRAVVTAGTIGVLLLMIGLGGAIAPVLGCATGSTARQTAAAGVVAALDCELTHATPDVVNDLKSLAEDRVGSWINGKPSDEALRAKVKADLVLFKSDAGRCAVVGALAAATVIVAPPGTVVQGLSASEPAAARAAFALAARELGWPPMRVAGGAVL